MLEVHVRAMTAADLTAVNEIYNYYVLHSTCTYQLEPETAEARAVWFRDHGPAHPTTVAEAAGRVVGWGSLSPFHAREGYARTVENSVYVDHDWHRRGIGRALLADLIHRARALGYHSIIAGIDAAQAGSIVLHRRLGFEEVGRLREVGYKFERWLDVIYMQLPL